MPRYAHTVEWLLDENDELVAVDPAEDLRRLLRETLQLAAVNRVYIANSRALTQRVHHRLNAWKLWRQTNANKSVH